MTVAIIGSGFAGLAASHGLSKAGRPSIVFEAKSDWGGHTHSTMESGFTFDEGPHVSFTKDERVREVFTEGARDVEEFGATIGNTYKGNWIPHPAQVHLYGLDPDLVTKCISDFVSAQQNPPAINNYADWCVAMFGQTFAETFPFAYTRKYWTVEASFMSTDWVQQRMYPPTLEEVVKGALTSKIEGEFHYLSKFRYPTRGGYQSFMRAMARVSTINCDKKVVSVNVETHELLFEDGETFTYDELVSTMPLPLLIRSITGRAVPEEVTSAAETLLCSSLVLVDIGVDRADLSENNWFYVYDENLSITRVHFPHMLSAGNAPFGKGSIQAEIYYSRFKPLSTSPENLPDRVVDELISLGILRNRAEVIFAKSRVVPFANVVFDLNRAEALKTIQPFIRSCDIHLAGRYGEWGYHWTDDATNSGWKAAADISGTSVEELFA